MKRTKTRQSCEIVIMHRGSGCVESCQLESGLCARALLKHEPKTMESKSWLVHKHIIKLLARSSLGFFTTINNHLSRGTNGRRGAGENDMLWYWIRITTVLFRSSRLRWWRCCCYICCRWKDRWIWLRRRGWRGKWNRLSSSHRTDRNNRNRQNRWRGRRSNSISKQSSARWWNWRLNSGNKRWSRRRSNLRQRRESDWPIPCISTLLMLRRNQQGRECWQQWRGRRRKRSSAVNLLTFGFGSWTRTNKQERKKENKQAWFTQWTWRVHNTNNKQRETTSVAGERNIPSSMQPGSSFSRSAALKNGRKDPDGYIMTLPKVYSSSSSSSKWRLLCLLLAEMDKEEEDFKDDEDEDDEDKICTSPSVSLSERIMMSSFRTADCLSLRSAAAAAGVGREESRGEAEGVPDPTPEKDRPARGSESDVEDEGKEEDDEHAEEEEEEDCELCRCCFCSCWSSS